MTTASGMHKDKSTQNKKGICKLMYLVSSLLLNWCYILCSLYEDQFQSAWYVFCCCLATTDLSKMYFKSGSGNWLPKKQDITYFPRVFIQIYSCTYMYTQLSPSLYSATMIIRTSFVLHFDYPDTSKHKQFTSMHVQRVG